jgi:hypothetical protein
VSEISRLGEELGVDRKAVENSGFKIQQIIMQIPETPHSIAELDFMKRLAEYGAGTASYLPACESLGKNARELCAEHHAMLIRLEKTVAPLLDKVTAKEMDLFTAHDRKHALKVAHLMWHIIPPQSLHEQCSHYVSRFASH